MIKKGMVLKDRVTKELSFVTSVDEAFVSYEGSFCAGQVKTGALDAEFEVFRLVTVSDQPMKVTPAFAGPIAAKHLGGRYNPAGRFRDPVGGWVIHPSGQVDSCQAFVDIMQEAVDEAYNR